MLNSQLYTVASEPAPTGDLSVPDPSPADAEKAIAESFLSSLPVIHEGRFVPPEELPQEIKEAILKNGWTDGAAESLFLGAEAYRPMLSAIYDGLGIPQELARGRTNE